MLMLLTTKASLALYTLEVELLFNQLTSLFLKQETTFIGLVLTNLEENLTNTMSINVQLFEIEYPMIIHIVYFKYFSFISTNLYRFI